MQISSIGSFSYQALRVNFEFVRMQSTSSASTATEQPEAIAPTEPPVLQPAEVALEQPRRSLDAAGDAGSRTRVTDEDDDRDGDDNGAAPGSIAVAQRLGRGISRELRPLLRGNSGLDRETRHEIRDALHEMRHGLRDAARSASEDDGFDVEAFAAAAADAVENFAGSFASAFGIELDDEPTDEGTSGDVSEDAAPAPRTPDVTESVA